MSVELDQSFLAANDDHVLLFGPSGNFTVHPFNYSKLSYNPADLVPIARASNTLIAAAVKADAPYNNVKEFTDAVRAMADAAVADRLEKAGILGVTTTPAEFEKYFRDEAERWAKVYKESGIKLD